jgi:hypothetical protein
MIVLQNTCMLLLCRLKALKSWGGGSRLTKLEENKKNDYLVENHEIYLGGEIYNLLSIIIT